MAPGTRVLVRPLEPIGREGELRTLGVFDVKGKPLYNPAPRKDKCYFLFQQSLSTIIT
jgi:hypothetical protein